jgi:cell division transport system permease protein
MKTNDLALDQDDIGTRFVTLVVIMMTALATLAVGGALIVQGLRTSWVDAVNGHMTIEIPANDGHGTVRGNGVLQETATRIRSELEANENIADIRIMDHADIEKLVAPWLGENAGSEDLPLPSLIALTLTNPGDQKAIAAIAQTVSGIDPAATTETHQTWLGDLRRFSLVLLLASAAMAAITMACSILTVAGAVRARLAAHHGDIDLLHVMGATDNYIGGQFVRVVVYDVGRAALIGTALGLILLKIAGLIAGELQSAMLPAFHWNMGAFLWFLAVPAIITALCFMAARFTVLRNLQVMP